MDADRETTMMMHAGLSVAMQVGGIGETHATTGHSMGVEPAKMKSSERRRLQNREAARRCQTKKKKYVDDLRMKIDEQVRSTKVHTKAFMSDPER